MAIYSTVGKLTNQIRYFSSATDVTSSIKSMFIEEAETVVNVKLSQRYNVPFGVNSVPPIIQTITTKLAAISLLEFIGLKGDKQGKSGAVSRLSLYETLLNDLGNGVTSLTNSDGSVVTPTQTVVSAKSNTSGYKPVFDLRDDMVWGVDADLIDDEDNEAL